MTQDRRKILYIDLANTMVDFGHRIEGLDPVVVDKYRGRMDEAFTELSALFDTYLLSSAPWRNPSGWQHKIEWLHEHLGAEEDSPAYKRLILTHHKDLNRGDFLVDDRPNNGAERFEGEWIPRI